MSGPRITIYGKGDRLTFGKYKGQLVEEVIASDPDYLVWAHNNIEWFELEEEAMEDVLLVTTGKTTRAKGNPLGGTKEKEATPRQKQPPLFDDFDEDEPPF